MDESPSHFDQKIGLVAGWGRFPVVVAETLRDQGRDVVCCGIKGHADASLAKICQHFRWFGMGKMGQQLRYLQRHRVTSATLAGKIFKTLLFQKFHLLRHLPDWKCIQHFYPFYFSASKDRKDDSLLTTVTELFGSGGVNFAPATDFVPQLLAPAGVLTHRRPTARQYQDVAFAWSLAKEMGQLDVGQAVAAKGKAVLAVEAIEGTDACIQRAGLLCSSGGFVVAKVAKPQQDMRFDVPTIGISTIETMHAAGATVLAIEADKTIMLDQTEVVRRANQLNLSIVALHDHERNRFGLFTD